MDILHLETTILDTTNVLNNVDPMQIVRWALNLAKTLEEEISGFFTELSRQHIKEAVRILEQIEYEEDPKDAINRALSQLESARAAANMVYKEAARKFQDPSFSRLMARLVKNILTIGHSKPELQVSVRDAMEQIERICFYMSCIRKVQGADFELHKKIWTSYMYVPGILGYIRHVRSNDSMEEKMRAENEVSEFLKDVSNKGDWIFGPKINKMLQMLYSETEYESIVTYRWEYKFCDAPGNMYRISDFIFEEYQDPDGYNHLLN